MILWFPSAPRLLNACAFNYSIYIIIYNIYRGVTSIDAEEAVASSLFADLLNN